MLEYIFSRNKSVLIMVRILEYAFTSNNSVQNTHLQVIKVSKGAKIRNRYNQVPHLTQDTNGKVTTSQ